MASLLNQIFGPILERLPENNRLERIWILAKVDFKKRYYDSGLGLIWALLNPLLRLAVYTLAFAYIRTSRIDNFALYLFPGLLVWLFFMEVTNSGMTIMKAKRYLIENIQFNWIDIYLASAGSAFIGFCFNFVAFFIMSTYLEVYPSVYTLWFPLLMINILLISMGFAIILSSINIFLKDINHVWAIVTLAGFWTAPIFFTIEDIMAKIPWTVYVHPATATIVNLRKALFYHEQMDWHLFAVGWIYAVVVLFIAYLFFKWASPYAIEKV